MKMDKLFRDLPFEEDDLLEDMLVLGVLQQNLEQNMEYLNRSSRKRKFADLDNDNEEDDDEDEEDDDDEEEEDDDNEEEDGEEEEEDGEEEEEDEEEDGDEDNSDCPEQASVSCTSDPRCPADLADALAELKVPKLEDFSEIVHEVLDKIGHSPFRMKIAYEELCAWKSMMLKEAAKPNGDVSGKL